MNEPASPLRETRGGSKCKNDFRRREEEVGVTISFAASLSALQVSMGGFWYFFTFLSPLNCKLYYPKFVFQPPHPVSLTRRYP